MPAPILTMAATVTCQHGAPVKFTPGNSVFMLGGLPALSSSDFNVVVGCPFFIGLKPSPCVRVQWVEVPGGKLSGPGGVQLLTMASVGFCLSPEQAPQGAALIVSPGQAQVLA